MAEWILNPNRRISINLHIILTHLQRILPSHEVALWTGGLCYMLDVLGWTFDHAVGLYGLARVAVAYAVGLSGGTLA